MVFQLRLERANAANVQTWRKSLLDDAAASVEGQREGGHVWLDLTDVGMAGAQGTRGPVG